MKTTNFIGFSNELLNKFFYSWSKNEELDLFYLRDCALKCGLIREHVTHGKCDYELDCNCEFMTNKIPRICYRKRY